MGTLLPLSFYHNEDLLHLSRSLLGKFLMTRIGSVTTGGMIVETEAYQGPEDRASHAYAGRRTPRNEALYEEGGIAYVYQCYGVHFLFNVVTHGRDYPQAVLVRAIAPVIGIEEMQRRRKMPTPSRRLTAGPGALCQALGITREHNRLPLDSSVVWIEDRKVVVSPQQIMASPRVGVAYAGPDASLPWRFRIKENPWTSPAK